MAEKVKDYLVSLDASICLNNTRLTEAFYSLTTCFLDEAEKLIDASDGEAEKTAEKLKMKIDKIIAYRKLNKNLRYMKLQGCLFDT